MKFLLFAIVLLFQIVWIVEGFPLSSLASQENAASRASAEKPVTMNIPDERGSRKVRGIDDTDDNSNSPDNSKATKDQEDSEEEEEEEEEESGSGAEQPSRKTLDNSSLEEAETEKEESEIQASKLMTKTVENKDLSNISKRETDISEDENASEEKSGVENLGDDASQDTKSTVTATATATTTANDEKITNTLEKANEDKDATGRALIFNGHDVHHHHHHHHVVPVVQHAIHVQRPVHHHTHYIHKHHPVALNEGIVPYNAPVNYGVGYPYAAYPQYPVYPGVHVPYGGGGILNNCCCDSRFRKRNVLTEEEEDEEASGDSEEGSEDDQGESNKGGEQRCICSSPHTVAVAHPGWYGGECNNYGLDTHHMKTVYVDHGCHNVHHDNCHGHDICGCHGHVTSSTGPIHVVHHYNPEVWQEHVEHHDHGHHGAHHVVIDNPHPVSIGHVTHGCHPVVQCHDHHDYGGHNLHGYVGRWNACGCQPYHSGHY